MRSVRRGEAAYLELMREAKAQFDAEIAKNKEKGKAGRPRKEVAPVVADDDDIEIDFSDVVPAESPEQTAAPAPIPTTPAIPAISVPERKSPPKVAAQQSTFVRGVKKPPARKPAAKKKPAVKSPAGKKPTAKKKTAVKKTTVKKAVPSKAKRGKA